ncbi:MAG: tol-pal system protein YbgF [Desulfonatronovibrionaceae bacterium]
MRWIYFTSAVFFAFFLSGCAASSFSESDAWRLQQVEEGLYSLQEKQKYMDKSREDLQSRLDGLESRVEELQTVLSEIAVQEELYTGEDGFVRGPRPGEEDFVQDKGRPSEAAGNGTDMEEALKNQTAPSSDSDEKKENPGEAKNGVHHEYDRALELEQKDKWGQAREKLIGLKEKYPESPLQPNFQYWIGETYYSQKRYAQAILAFKQVVQDYPRSSKAPDALLKIAYSYSRLEDEENAAFYKRVLREDYPDSEAAAKLE